ncbi:MAG: hypothetical protein AAB654_12650 [Acidobacteriota bacterium]
MKATMTPVMQPVLALGEHNGRRSLRRNALVAAAAPSRSWSSMLYGEPAAKETEASIRRRMVDLILRLVSASGAITRDDLLGQFDEEQIAVHFRPALRAAGAHRMAVTW